MRIGIDFSINHIGVCVEKNDIYTFTIFIGEKQTKKYDILVNAPITTIFYQRNIDKSNYNTEQSTKLADAIKIANMLCDYLDNIIDEDCEIYLEGWSYNSKSNNTLDLVLYGSLVRFFIESRGFGSLNIVSPTEAKKSFTGKGNANKELMIKTFLDLDIDNEFLGYLKKIELDYQKLYHIDDLIDAYAIQYRQNK